MPYKLAVAQVLSSMPIKSICRWKQALSLLPVVAWEPVMYWSSTILIVLSIILENVLVFFSHESCGKCTPCREGGFRLLQLVRKFKDGTAKAEDIDTIRDLSETMKLASLCGLGQATPVPVLTCLDNFEAAFQDALNGESCCCCQERRQS